MGETLKNGLIRYFESAWAMLEAMAPWLLVGFAIAGLLSQLIPKSFIRKHLSRPGLGSVVKAVAIGIPLPLCSCGVIPVAAGLRNAGASKGAVAAFTASTPQTGVDSILATYSLMGLPFTIGRIIADVVSGMLAGIAIAVFDKDQPKPSADGEAEACCSSACSNGTRRSAESGISLAEGNPAGRSRFRAIIHEGFVELPRDIGKYIVVGILIGALLSVAIPEGALGEYLPHPLLSYIVVTAISIPVYVCATGSIPLAFGLIAGGLSPGAAIVFLVTGPATNSATIATLLKLIGKRSTLIYLAALLIGAWTVGFAFDQLDILPVGGLASIDDESGWVGSVSALAMVGIFINALRANKSRPIP